MPQERSVLQKVETVEQDHEPLQKKGRLDFSNDCHPDSFPVHSQKMRAAKKGEPSVFELRPKRKIMRFWSTEGRLNGKRKIWVCCTSGRKVVVLSLIGVKFAGSKGLKSCWLQWRTFW